jgi:hypothetical protein
MEKIDEIIAKITAEFEKKPIATTLKGVIVLWVLREMKKWWQDA